MPLLTGVILTDGQQMEIPVYEIPSNVTPCSLVYICPECGVDWARIAYFTEEGPCRWTSLRFPCKDHGDGSLLDKLNYGFCSRITSYDPAFFVREADLLLPRKGPST